MSTSVPVTERPKCRDLLLDCLRRVENTITTSPGILDSERGILKAWVLDAAVTFGLSEGLTSEIKDLFEAEYAVKRIEGIIEKVKRRMVRSALSLLVLVSYLS